LGRTGKFSSLKRPKNIAGYSVAYPYNARLAANAAAFCSSFSDPPLVRIQSHLSIQNSTFSFGVFRLATMFYAPVNPHALLWALFCACAYLDQ
jgi:hypothetical protein